MLQLTASTASGFAAQDTRTVIAERVRGEFRDLPSLTLTLAQALKLWSLDVAACTDVLSYLVSDGYLCRRADGAFCRHRI